MTDVNLNIQGIWSHYVATHDVYIRESYLILLAAIAFEDRVINPDESNYLQNLCESMSSISFDSILVRLKTFDADQFNEITTMIKKNQLVLLFFIDALLLCNSDTVISEDEAHLLSNLADTLELSDSMSRFGVLTSVAILKHDRDILLQAFSLINDDHGLDAVYQCYLKGWIEEKIGWDTDLVKGKIPAGKYIIYKPIIITMDTSIQNSELIFTKHGLITIDSQKELTIDETALTNGNIICKPKSSLVATNIKVNGGKGINAAKNTHFELDNSCFKASYITATQLSKLLITNTKFDEFIDAPALNISECSDVTLENCEFKLTGAAHQHIKTIKYCAIRVNASFIYIAKSQFINCTSSKDGGAIAFQSCLFGINDCSFTDCHSDKSGGAIAISGETYINSEETEYNNDQLSSFLSNPVLMKIESEQGWIVKISEEFFSPWVPRNVQTDAEKLPLISKTRFKACSAMDLGGAIMDSTDTIRLIECNFDDNYASSEGSSLALLGNMSITKWGVSIPETFNPKWFDRKGKTELNPGYCQIVNCEFISGSKGMNSDIFIQRLYQPHFMIGCSFQDSIVLVRYNSMDYKQAGWNIMEVDWQELLMALEKDFSIHIESDNKFKQQQALPNVTFDRHLLPPGLHYKGKRGNS